MDKFISLLGIEYQISRIYKDLFNVESNVNMDNLNDSYELFLALISELNKLLDDEEKTLISLSEDDIETINMILENGTIVNLNRNDSFSELINERISFRINGNNPKLDKYKSPLILNYIIDDFDNYYLSFLEDWIKNETDSFIKEYLFLKKYQYLFLVSRHLERDKIKDSFATEESIYTSSYFMSQYFKISNEKYDDIRNKYAVSKIVSTLHRISKLINNYDENNEKRLSYETILKLHIYNLRAALLIPTDNVREIVIEKIFEKAPFLVENINTIFNEDFEDIINEDKKRHKLLLLNI